MLNTFSLENLCKVISPETTVKLVSPNTPMFLETQVKFIEVTPDDGFFVTKIEWTEVPVVSICSVKNTDTDIHDLFKSILVNEKKDNEPDPIDFRSVVDDIEPEVDVDDDEFDDEVDDEVDDTPEVTDKEIMNKLTDEKFVLEMISTLCKKMF